MITMCSEKRAKWLNLGGVNPAAHVENEHLLSSSTRIRAGARLIGDVEAGEDTLIDTNAVIWGPVKLGKQTYVGPNCIVGFPNSSEIGELLRSDKITEKQSTIIGDNCIIRPGSSVYANVRIASDVSFGHNVLVREGVTIGEHTKIGTNVVVDGKSSIGSRVSIQTGVYICTYSTVEDAVFLGPCCVFTNDKYVVQKQFKLIGPTVKKGASIGANALLFPGITVGEGAVIGSQAMVNSDVPPRTIFAGIPAKRIGDVPSDWGSSLAGG
jgi:acetyltransferase-like isoleucine patch superfamily enzyme